MTSLTIVQKNVDSFVDLSTLKPGQWWRDMGGRLGIVTDSGAFGIFLDGTPVFSPDYMVTPLESVSVYVNDDTE